MDFRELKERVVYLRDRYRDLRIQLPAGEGLTLALDEAEALADGVKSPLPATDENAARTAHDAHVVWALSDNVKTCLESNLDVRAHLSNIATGSTAFGRPSANNRDIFYKDFEFELFIMATLLRAGLRIELPPGPNDPLREFDAEGLPVQLKHPNSQAKAQQRIRDFNGGLRAAGRVGIFIVGVEDMFRLADGGLFGDDAAYDAWLAERRTEMEAHGRPILESFGRFPHVAGVAQTATFVRYVDGDSQLTRTANSWVFDGGDRANERWFPDALRVLSVFNPQPVRASEL